LRQVGTSSLLIYEYMMHGHTYIKFGCIKVFVINCLSNYASAAQVTLRGMIELLVF